MICPKRKHSKEIIRISSNLSAYSRVRVKRPPEHKSQHLKHQKLIEDASICVCLIREDSLISINRIIDIFPENQQDQVRVTTSFVLQGVISQQLIPKIGGGRVLALETMICTPAIRALIRDDKVHQMYSLVQAGQKYGMKTIY